MLRVFRCSILFSNVFCFIFIKTSSKLSKWWFLSINSIENSAKWPKARKIDFGLIIFKSKRFPAEMFRKLKIFWFLGVLLAIKTKFSANFVLFWLFFEFSSGKWKIPSKMPDNVHFSLYSFWNSSNPSFFRCSSSFSTVFSP